MRCRKEPCRECPWVVATPPGKFSAARYEALRETTGDPGGEAPVGAAMFACHMTTAGRETPCAGWLAAVGYESLTVRLNLARGEIPHEAMEPGEDWPELHRSYDEMAAAKGG